MARSTPNLYPVILTPKQRERLEQMTHHGHAPVRKIRHAQVLLLSDHNRPKGRMTRLQVSDVLTMHVNTVYRIRRRFVREGEAPSLDRKIRVTPPTSPRLDARPEAQLGAICCSAAPKGRTHWMLKLLTHELVKRRIVTSICMETVRKTLKKTSCSPGENNFGASRSGTGKRRASPEGDWGYSRGREFACLVRSGLYLSGSSALAGRKNI
jgi:Homeodomain-like domain